MRHLFTYLIYTFFFLNFLLALPLKTATAQESSTRIGLELENVDPTFKPVSQLGKRFVKEEKNAELYSVDKLHKVIKDQMTVEKSLNNEKQVQRKIYETCFIILVGYVLLFVLLNIINRSVVDIKVRHSIRKNLIYFITSLMVVIIFFIWVQKLNSLTIFFGVAGAGLALALQEVILCVAGWVLIMTRRPYDVGDRIELNGIKGDIIDIRVFQTSLLEIGNWIKADQSTGRIVNIPNSAIFKSANYNYSRGFDFIWHEIPIVVTFESDWALAKSIILANAKKLSEGMEDEVRRKIAVMRNRYMIYYGKLTPIVYVDIKDSGVELTLRILTEAKKRRFISDQIAQMILEDFAKEATVDFAYPTYRIVKS